MKVQATKRHVYQFMAALGACVAVVSCGGNGASNNDQGMSVTFLGLFNSNRLTTSTVTGGAGGVGLTPGQLGCGQLPAGIIGAYIQLGEIGPEPGGTLTPTNLSGTDPAGAFVAVVGIQNNLYGQAFRAERLLLDFYVPGASEQPPSTSVPISLIAGPAESAQNSVGGQANQNNQNNQNQTMNPGLRRPIFTSLPPSFSNLCNRALSQATIVPASIREWLNFNRDLLPPAPFKLEVVMRVSGLTSSGDRLETNDVVLDVDVLPETYVVGGGDTDLTPTPDPTAAAGSEGAQEGDGGLEQLGE
jgi:hypothetical protein